MLSRDRVLYINAKAASVLQEYESDLQKAFQQGDLMEVGRLRSSVNWVLKILQLANKPYISELRPFIDDRILRQLGLLDDDSQTSPQSGRYPWDELDADTEQRLNELLGQLFGEDS